LEGGVRRSAASVLAAHSPQAFAIGTLFHAWLAEMEWLDAGLPSDDALVQVAAQLRSEIGGMAEQITSLIGRFRQQLSAAPIAEILSRRFYDSPANLGLAKLKSKPWPGGKIELSVVTERPFAIRSGDNILSGSIDRLVVIKSGGRPIAADVLDFKTDEIDPDNNKALAAKVAFYQPQMEAYRVAAAKLLSIGTANIAARLVFLQAGAVSDV